MAPSNVPPPGTAASSTTWELPAVNMTVPEWVTDFLQVSGDKVARLETHLSAYNLMLEYLAHRAVDIWESQPNPVESDEERSKKAEILLSKREYTGRLSSLIMMNTGNSSKIHKIGEPEKPISLVDPFKDIEKPPPHATYLFGVGAARLWHDEQPVCVIHSRERKAKIRKLCFFAADEMLLRKLGDDVLLWNINRKKRKTSKGKYQLYSLKFGVTPRWEHQGWKPARSIESVILPKGMLESIVDDFRHFASIETQEWYLGHGLPYRRSYLFYGPPGVGKTSTIRCLAGLLKLNACFLTLGGRKVSGDGLLTALRCIPRPCLLVIEDVDALFKENRQSETSSDLTFSEMLNTLDGLISQDGLVTVMTTNHIEKLDPALIRAGRVDRKFEFKLPTQAQMASLFASFYPDAEEKICLEFAAKVFSRQEREAKNIATLQQHFIYTKNLSARESIDKLDQFFTDFYPEGGYDRSNSIYI